MQDGLSTTAALRWSVAGCTIAAIYVCWQLWPALLLAAWTAALTRPLLVRFERWLKGRRRAAATVSLLLFLVLLLPLSVIVLGVVSGAQELVRVISQASSTKGVLVAITEPTSGAGLPQLPKNLAGVLDLLERYGAQGLDLLTGVAGAAAKGLVACLIYFGGSFVFLTDGSAAWEWFKRHSPLKPEHLDRYTAAFHETGRGLLIGVGLTSATQGLVATVVYGALGVPRWWVLGPITGIASMIPVVGSSFVWAPIMLGLFLTGHPVKGVILIVLGLGVIGSIDNLLGPIYARMGALKMPMYLLFIAIFGGIAAFGTWGALLGPLVIRLWMESFMLRPDSESDPPKSPNPAL